MMKLLVVLSILALSHTAENDTKNVLDLHFLAELVVPFGFSVNDQPFGGNSGLAYDPDTDTFYMLKSPVKNGRGPAVMKLKMTIDETGYCTLDVTNGFLLRDSSGKNFPAIVIQPSSLEFFQGSLLWSTDIEGCDGHPHRIRRSDLEGNELELFPVPPHHIPVSDPFVGQISGVPAGMGFSGISASSIDNLLFAINRGPLVQDEEANEDGIVYVPLTIYELVGADADPLTRDPSLPLANINVTTEYLWPLGPIPYSFDSLEVAEITRLTADKAIVLETAKNSDTGKFRSWLYLLKLKISTIDPATNYTTVVYQATPTMGLRINYSLKDLNITESGPIFPLVKELIMQISEKTTPLGRNRLDKLENMVFGKDLENGTHVLITGANDQYEAKPRFGQSLAWTIGQTDEQLMHHKFS